MTGSPSLMQQMISDTVLEQAFHWVCQARNNRHYNDDIWHLRFYWQRIKAGIQVRLLTGGYQFTPCKAVKIAEGNVGVWCAQDAVVLKAAGIVLTPALQSQLSERIFHLPGRGGAKSAVSQLKSQVHQYGFVCRSDVNSYYASIQHDILTAQLKGLLQETALITLLTNMLARLDDVNGELVSVLKGINKGNPLSPLLGAIYLRGLDTHMQAYCNRHQLCYMRFMDDWVVLCKTRHQLRKAVRIMNQCLDDVKQSKHPFKTYIGKIKTTGFDFLGYRIIPNPDRTITLAWKTLANHISKLQQLYEQNTHIHGIAQYVKRWLIWVRSGVKIDLQNVADELLASRLMNTLGEERLEEYKRVLFREIGAWAAMR